MGLVEDLYAAELDRALAVGEEKRDGPIGLERILGEVVFQCAGGPLRGLGRVGWALEIPILL